MAVNATITLKINDEYINNKEVAYLYPYFINILAYNIAKNTPIEYWVKDKSNSHVSFTIKSYTNEDKKKTHKEVIKEKTNIISQHISTLNAKQFSAQELWLLRTLMLMMKSHNMEFDKILQLIVKDGDETILNKQLQFIIDGLQLVEYKIIRLQDGSTIRQLIDPYVKWYGVFCDYSKTFDEYNYMYNGLHVYEHYIANCWDDMSDNNVITFNGGTYSNGLMYIYSVVSDINTLKERFIRYITFHIKSSDTSFIKQSSILERETIRTISEGYKLRNLTRLARTSQQGFDLNYPVNVFAYWSSQPMNILLITNKELNINVNNLNELYKRYHKHVDKPQQQHFNYFPREIYHMMTIENKHLYKKSTDKIVKKIFNGKFTSLYGIDTRCVAYKPSETSKDDKKKLIAEDDKKKPNGESNCLSKAKPTKINLSRNHTLIHQLLIYAKFVSDDYIKDYVKRTPLPNYATDYEEMSIIDYSRRLTPH